MRNSISNLILNSDFFKLARSSKPEGFNSKIDKIISSHTDSDALRYTNDLDEVLNLIKDDSICEYQDSILKELIESFDSDFVDVDYLGLYLNVTSKEIELLTDNRHGLVNVKTKSRREFISVKESRNLSNINSYLKNTDNRSYYTHRYSIILSGDTYRSIEVFIGDPSHEKNVGRDHLLHNVCISLIPTRFTLFEITLAFWHIKSVLKNNRFYTVMKNATVSRFDVGINLFGFSQLFCFAITADKRVKNGASCPEEGISQTAYLGTTERSNTIHYDKSLKEFSSFLKFHGEKVDGHQVEDLLEEEPEFSKLYSKNPSTTRSEGRQIAHPNPFKLSEISNVRCLLSNIRYIKPSLLKLVPEYLLEKVIEDKNIDNINKVVEWLKNNVSTKESDLYYKFDENKLQKFATKKLDELLDVITAPLKIADDPSNAYNYSDSSAKVRGFLSLAARNRLIENPESITIDDSKITFIEGGAGAGKTALIVGLIEKNGKRYQSKTTVLSFTNASVKDIFESLNRTLSSNKVTVETMSRWCKLFLESNGYIINKLIDNQRSHAIMQKFLDEIMLQGESEEAITGEDVFKVFSYYRNRINPDLEVSIEKVNENLLKHRKVIQKVINRYNRFKKTSKQEDFDGVIEQVALLLENKKVAKKFIGKMEYLFVDEIQDFNATQWDILKKLKKYGVKIVVVGDRAQSIYQWRGAIPAELNDQDLKVYKLRINYRSTQQIVDVTNYVRTRICKTLEPVISRGSDGGVKNGTKPRVHISDDIAEAAAWVKKDIDFRGFKKHECFILCRFRKQMQHFEKIFGKENVGLVSDPVKTFHSSKGLQSKHVYVIDPRFSWMGFTNAQDELCNLYVALSRPMDTLTIVKTNKTVFRKSKPDQKKLNILDKLDETLVEFV
jgi:DNA helicase-2/ATP-dependent DNA helicase PcrA